MIFNDEYNTGIKITRESLTSNVPKTVGLSSVSTIFEGLVRLGIHQGQNSSILAQFGYQKYRCFYFYTEVGSNLTLQINDTVLFNLSEMGSNIAFVQGDNTLKGKIRDIMPFTTDICDFDKEIYFYVDGV